MRGTTERQASQHLFPARLVAEARLRRLLESWTMRSVRVAPGATPTTRTPLSVLRPPSAAVNAISAAFPAAPQT